MPALRRARFRLPVIAVAAVALLTACGQAGADRSATPTSGPSAPVSSVGTSDSAPAVVTVPSLTVGVPSTPSSATPPPVLTTVTTTVPRSTAKPVTTPATSRPDPTSESDPTTAAPRTTPTRSSTSSRPTTPATPNQQGGGGRMTGKIVAIDPGHNGQNAAHPEIINQKIDGGNGFENVCNTVGTETNNGYSEHAFNWKVSMYLKQELEAKGITVVMTRHDDNGVGPCTPKRAQIENESGAAAVISIHGDGVGSNVRGFYVLTNGKPTHGQELADKSLQLARKVRDGLINEGFPPSNDLGNNGLWTRADLTGLNLSTKPKVLVELGNMRNSQEAAIMSSADGQRRYAKALAAGVIAYLIGG